MQQGHDHHPHHDHILNQVSKPASEICSLVGSLDDDKQNPWVKQSVEIIVDASGSR